MHATRIIAPPSAIVRLVGSSSSSTDHNTPKPVLKKLADMEAMGGMCCTMRMNIQ